MSQYSSFSSEMELEQDSMLSLNDDCLRKIFISMDNETLCSMANVCKRFRPIAEEVFHRYRKDITFGYSFKLSRRVFCKFGHLIQSLKGTASYTSNVDGIAKYCRLNLKHLKLHYVTIDCNVMEPIFRQLKTLHLVCCEFIGSIKKLFGNCLQVEEMHLKSHDLVSDLGDNVLAQTFPTLKEVDLKCIPIEYDKFYEFLILNPQLKKLCVDIESEDKYITAIVRCIPNLEHLQLSIWRTLDSSNKTEDGFLELAKLKKLKHLKLDSYGQFDNQFACSLMERFSLANVPLESSALLGFDVNLLKVLNISHFKTIIELEFRGDVHENDLICAVEMFPKLTKIGINDELLLTANGLINLVTIGKQLTHISLWNVKDLHINEHVFKTLLSAIQSDDSKRHHTFIMINGSKLEASFDVPKTLQRSCERNLSVLSFIQS